MQSLQIGPEELNTLLKSSTPPVLIDVREPSEWAICQLPGAKHIPLAELLKSAPELDPETSYVIYCHHGGRSLYATQFLREQGFGSVLNLDGGIDLWSERIDPSVKRYELA